MKSGDSGWEFCLLNLFHVLIIRVKSMSKPMDANIGIFNRNRLEILFPPSVKYVLNFIFADLGVLFNRPFRSEIHRTAAAVAEFTGYFRSGI